MQVLLTALISALTSIIVVMLSHVLSTRRDARQAEETERERINAEYLNPLRMHLVENQFRLSEILHKVDGRHACPELLTVDSPSQVSEKDAEWFNGWGVYLISSAYMTACLFAQMKKLREDYPYLRLENAQDTRLAAIMLQVSLAFRRDLGIYYATQPSIGEDLLVRDLLLGMALACARDPVRAVLAVAGTWLAGNGRVLFIDEHVDERGKETYIAGCDEVVERQLRDGSTFRVIKKFVNPEELELQLRRLGWDARSDGSPRAGHMARRGPRGSTAWSSPGHQQRADGCGEPRTSKPRKSSDCNELQQP